MSSHELLELAEFMDEAGRFKAGLRSRNAAHPWLLHPWSAPAHADFQTANEASLVRAAKIEGEDLSERIGSTLFIDPDTLRVLAADQEFAAAARGDLFNHAGRTE